MNESAAPENPLARRFDGPALFRFALPTMLMMVFMGLYTLVDTVFVSRFVNTDALAAINIVCPVLNVTVGLGAMLATGGSAVISRCMGEGRGRAARENFTLIFLSGVLLGLSLSAAGLLWMDGLVRALGASDALFGYCKDYLAVLFLFLPANILQTLFSNLFVTAGRPGLGSALAVGAGVANILLDYLFIAVCGMGIRGAALGTGLGYLLPAGAGCLYFARGRGTLAFCRPKWRPGVLAESCLNGSSEMVGQLAAAITTFLFNNAMLRLLGEDGVAAVTIMIYAQFLLNTLYIGFSMGVAPVIGYQFGAKNDAMLKKVVKSCLLFIAVSSISVFCLSFFGGPWLVRLFARHGSEVYEIAAPGFRIFSPAFLFCGLNLFSSALFTALSNGKVSALLSFLRTFLFLAGGILLLPRVFGAAGVWLAVPVAEGCAAAVSIRFLMRSRR